MAQSAYDLTLAIPEADVTLKLNVYRPETKTGSRKAPALSVVPQPLREGEQFFRQEQRATYADASGGAGYGERLAQNVYHHGLPADARMPGIVLPPGRLTEVSMAAVPMPGSVFAFIDAFWVSGVHTFIVGARYCARMPLGTGTPELFKDLGAAFTGQSVVNWYGNLIVGGAGAPIWKFDTATGAWTQSADVWRQYLETVRWTRGGADLPRLIGSTAPSAPGYLWPDRSMEYTDNADPMTESVWSEEIFVGDTGHSITNVIVSNRHAYFLKTNGLYDMDDRLYSPNLTDYRKHLTDVINPQAGWVSQGHAYFGSRTGLDRVSLAQQGVRQDLAQRCEFGANTPNYGPIRGTPTAGISDGLGNWVCYYNETSQTTYLCHATDWSDVQGIAAPARRGVMQHHGAFAVIPGVQIVALHLSAPSGAAYAPRLWLGGYRVATSAPYVAWMSLPQAGSPYQDWIAGGPMRFADTMIIDYPRENHGSDVSRKDLTRIAIRGDDLGTATLSAYAQFDGATFASGLPESLGQATSAYEEFDVTDPTDVRDMTFRVVGNGTSAVPPILRALEAQAGVSVEANTVHTYVCEFGGSGDTRDQFMIETELEAIRAKRGTLTDHRRRREYQGRVLQDLSWVWEELPSGEKTGRVIVTLPFLAQGSGWVFDSGRFFDAGLRLG